MPAAGTINIVNYVCKREAEGALSKPKRPKNFCLWQALKLLGTKREAKGALSKPKKFCLRQELI